ncbi:hypothetical protein CHLNCDRAFT_145449 [Chlorella variabilis]|uniref:Amidinotransferase n=1 Tax=Chlorella variabilis TaxID=554065 RepID=E1ZEG1_CHLVA|nr:hypothetical protein CHLNCDRAFT_145449 [Chlorella variabilis]EFN55864.1 hypothetical protein CHLNCDRAFT_145449 [Chlorella variabilis]|eukprot:XP_005847966.1 hypothetical protein CHLNCDRAFT_145449 [Chlorella variabilis]
MLQRAGKRLLQAAGPPGLLRQLSSLPEKAIHDTGFGEFVPLSDKAGVPVLVRLHERPWGALARLPASKLTEAGYAGNQLPSHVAVVRDAFGAHDDSHRALAQEVAALGPDKVAVASDLTHPHNRLIVDDYELAEDGQYRLRTVGTDLLRFFKQHDMHTILVPEVAAAAAGTSTSAKAAHRGIKQSTNEVLMVAPTAFVFNDQAAQDNTFMNSAVNSFDPPGVAAGQPPPLSVTKRVLREFAGLHHELTEVAGVKVNLFQHSLSHGTPDAVFPNNWFSTHPAGEAAGGVKHDTLVFYPMKCPNRQAERREDIKEVLQHWGYGRTLDMSPFEAEGHYFEGTGVLVIDRINGVAYVALSERADRGLAERWVAQLGYNDLVTFTSSDAGGGTVYHTNVMMAIGTDVAVVCLESVEDEGERRNLQQKLGQTHTIVDITRQQMAALCGNVLELEDGRGLPVLAMSTQAYNAFTEDQKRVLRRHVAALHHAPIDTLEHIGGGGVRCTLAEIF